MNTKEYNYLLIKRDGSVAQFDPAKIRDAITKAFAAVYKGADPATLSISLDRVMLGVLQSIHDTSPLGGSLCIEDIQNTVEESLLHFGFANVSHAYVAYREVRAASRPSEYPKKSPNIEAMIHDCCVGLSDVSATLLTSEASRALYPGASVEDIRKAAVMAARSLIEQEPNYSFVAARLLLVSIYKEVFNSVEFPGDTCGYAPYFPDFIKKGIYHGLLDKRMAEFNLVGLSEALKPDRDMQFDYLGLQTLYDRYFLHVNKIRIELPQAFFMRVAMGLAINEPNKDARAIEFYDVLSSFDFMSSTPTLFNSGTAHSQLSSCYLSTIPDDLGGIFDGIKENALLSKFAGGLGNDWTRVRALGSHIKGTNGESQGVVPFLKVVNDTAVAVNQGGKRKGAVCAYIETWHLDIEEFLELRKNTGDDRRRTHDMNTANWVPDLFMKRVKEKGTWTLFSPNDVPDLHDKYGRDFESAYTAYEAATVRGGISVFRIVQAADLWRKMLTMLFETGHPWITFKDACNIRSPQKHVGVVRSSNLCTEITLNTSDTETAVCNLGSINLAQHIKDGVLDKEKLLRTVRVAMRMLDNVIDINYYPVEKAKTSNLKHRPVGLGIMGFQDCLYKLRIPYSSQEAVEFADTTMEAVCYATYTCSSELAKERGAYSSFAGSDWDIGILPLDTLFALGHQRGGNVHVNTQSSLDWRRLRDTIQHDGMRNSNCVAIAPTATISNIVGVDASIEPSFTNLSVKSNLSGEFTMINRYLVDDLKKLGLWNQEMVNSLKRNDGSIQNIEGIPADIKELYKTAFEVGPVWLIEAAARRQKWIDQAQSLNLYVSNATGKVLNDIYMLAWERGLKTTYYLRTNGATSAEKSTISDGKMNSVDSGQPKFCSIDNPSCEACQ